VSALDDLAEEMVASIRSLLTLTIGLIGVALGGFLTSRNQRKEREQRFFRDQLAEFYAPMLAMHNIIRAKSEIRLKMSRTAHEEWQRLINEAQRFGIDRVQEVRKEAWPKYEKIIEYENQQLSDELLPLYRRMRELFVEKMHLAEPSTRGHFDALVEFVEMWDRWRGGALPPEVSERIGPREENLKPFYEDLAANFEKLQTAQKYRATRKIANRDRS
jgi:hypothetical protein